MKSKKNKHNVVGMLGGSLPSVGVSSLVLPSQGNGYISVTSSSTINVSSTTTGTLSYGGTYSYMIPPSFFSINIQSTIKYNVLGNDINVSGSYRDISTCICLANINIMGMSYYIELKKQGIEFPKEIENILEKELLLYKRDNNIKEIME